MLERRREGKGEVDGLKGKWVLTTEKTRQLFDHGHMTFKMSGFCIKLIITKA